jgi:hypothetical protein
MIASAALQAVFLYIIAGLGTIKRAYLHLSR